MKRFLFTLSLFCTLSAALADEGMWLPSLIERGIIDDMQRKGLKLSAADLYSVNQASLKDAIVRFGSGCTGELISDQGLLLTNHHCGYPQIQKHSTLQHDYLTHGFAASNRSEELPNPGLVVSFLVEMRDVTDQALHGIKPGATEEQRAKGVAANSKKIVQKATAGTHYQGRVEALYYGNQYFLFIYEVFEDVRLVFAPPSSIGKFGGDTDNWMWPRHTGDFSLFRIYADKENKPAKYAADNVPYRPKKSFTISLKGVEQGDFTFLYGFPARTYEYLHSQGVRYILEKSDPEKVKLRTLRLDVMNAAMAADPAVRIQYAAKNASVSNGWKKWQGEMKGLERLGTVQRKAGYEARFEEWAATRPYAGITRILGTQYDSLEAFAYARDCYAETVMAVELFKLADSLRLSKDAPRTQAMADAFFKDYNAAIDRRTASLLLAELRREADDFLPDPFRQAASAEAFVEGLFTQTRVTDSAWVRATLALAPEERKKTVEQDVAVQAIAAFKQVFDKRIDPPFRRWNAAIETSYRTYMRGMMEMGGQAFYPDANSTLRIAYGEVRGYSPRDGVDYRCQTTLDGVIEKVNPAIYDYNVPQALISLHRAKNYGRWAVDGTVPVAFIATNHSSGGNSGSPVLNANGELIGVNFDRCWEGTMSDLEFDPSVCRNITLDIRYALFIIDKLGGAGYLLNEMRFAK